MATPARAYFFARHATVPPTPNAPVRPTELIYYLRLEDPASYVPTVTVPLCVNGFRGPEERVYDVILAGTLAGWSANATFAEVVVDLVLLLRAMALQELRDRWRFVSRGTQAGDENGGHLEQAHSEVSRMVRPSYGLQRSGSHMLHDATLYATFAADPRELEDIVLVGVNAAWAIMNPPRISVVVVRDPLLHSRFT
ncbi:hypothetical protein C8T65DRAFT_739172 [Cerioporus squamosus]|nr:hypothetical protein C8T65DRAFT_739172 [Cerioporus squamosus]